MKTRQPLPAKDDLHRETVAYISDFGLLYSALLPHGFNYLDRQKTFKALALASIDHAIWYHRPVVADQWLYYHCVPLSTSGGRGLSRGSFYDAGGQLVVSTIQEGLMRKLSKT